jgi:hypothetical protein
MDCTKADLQENLREIKGAKQERRFTGSYFSAPQDQKHQ